MIPQGKQLASSATMVAVALSLFALPPLLVSCKDSQVPPEPAAPSSSWEPNATTLTFKVETPDGTTSPLLLIATEITWAPGSGILRAKVALHNSGPDAITGPSTIEVFDFFPNDVTPLNAICGIVVGPCWYEYAGTYGDDGVLSPGETSAAVEWQILNIRGEGFRFRTRLGGIPDPGGRIGGVVFHDSNRDGIRGRNEPGIPGVVISLRDSSLARITRTNADGYFEFRVSRVGVYSVHKNATDGCRDTTPPAMLVVVFRDINGNLSNFLSADFGCWRIPVPGPGVGGVVFNDSNRNGKRDPNEPGLGGYVVSLQAYPPDTRDELCEPHAPILWPQRLPSSTISDRDGNWFLPASDITCDLPWLIQRGQNVGMDPQQPPLPALFGTTPSNHVVFNLPGPGGLMQIDFGLAPTDTSNPEPILVVQGMVFVDTNENGIRDTNEQGARGVRMSLLSPCDRLDTTWTDYFGTTRFEPPATAFCEIGGVAVSEAPDRTTTTNPILFPPPTTPGIHLVTADFGVRP